ncbi:MAG TPA: hypothetical protein VK806_12190, partial [Bacteroidia bacterium]|nr:hypothetical protein [Bacteroidia bacterium]
DLGVEFYYNYKKSESMEDNTKGILLEQATFYRGRVFNWQYYPPYGLINYNSSVLGTFGILNAGLSYHITPKFSAAFESTLRFTNPFAPDPVVESFSATRGLANLSLNLGLNYSFQTEDIGSFKNIDKDDDSKGLMIGFNIMPNYYVYPNFQSVNNDGFSWFSFSYEFSAQCNLSNTFAFETGIILDNYNEAGLSDNVLMGIPALLKYYFPHKPGSNSYYLGAGFHIDYHTNIGFPYNTAPVRYIQPIALAEGGYEIPIANKYCLNFALGYEHEIKYIVLSDNTSASASFSQLPHILYSSIGFSYKFK